MKKKITLVLGGARSGKSTYALKFAEEHFSDPVYLATAEAGDKEMTDRIAHHKEERGAHWGCIEESLDIAGVITSPPEECDGILLDCLTLWLTNVLLKEGEDRYEQRKDELFQAISSSKCDVVIVSNEVGMGIVPDTELGRKFRDLAGRLNQELAQKSDSVVFVAAGLPMELK